MTKFISIVWAQAFGALSLFALFSAQCYALDVKLLGAIGWDDAGGDRISLPNADSASASRGLTSKIGLEVWNNESKTFATQFYLGNKSSHTIVEEIGRGLPNMFIGRYARFTRETIEIVEQYQFSDQYRLGAGITYHLNPRLECVEREVDACKSISTIHLNDAWGGLIQFSGVWNDTVEAGIRYTFIDYKNDGQRYDGSSWGLFAGFRIAFKLNLWE